MIELPRSLQIFEMRDGIDYEFVMPGIMIGGHSATSDVVAGRWVLRQEVNGRTYVAEHESEFCAVLLLIAQRGGYTGELRFMGDGAGSAPNE